VPPWLHGPETRPLLPGDGWQQRLLAGLASEDDRISDMRMHGSASSAAATADRWSDLDLLVIATDPAGAAEHLARRIEDHVESMFWASRSGAIRVTARLVLADLRRIDMSAVPGVHGRHLPELRTWSAQGAR
jgi:hypothetical protein